MIPKRTLASCWHDTGLASVLLNVGSRGFDRDQLHKLAADTLLNLPGLQSFQARPGHAYLRVITNGAGEVYGCNCFFRGTQVQTSEGLQSIEDIAEGTEVLTHRGRYRPVKHCMSSEYTGRVASFKICGLPEPVTCTAEHPILVIRRPTSLGVMRNYWKRKGTQTEYMRGLLQSAAFVPAETLRPGDLVITPVESGKEGSTTPRHAPYVYGLYLSEGCLGRESKNISTRGEPKSVILSLSEKDKTMLERVQQFRKDQGKSIPAWHALSNSIEARRIDICDKELATECLRLFGQHAKTKRLSAEVFTWSREERAELLAGYLDGDGHIGLEGNGTGAIKASTASLTLALDLRRLGASLDIPVSVSHCMNRQENGCKGEGECDIYALSISASNAKEVLTHCLRLKAPFRYTGRTQAKQYIVDNMILSAVTSITLTETEGTTRYNLEVEEDNTFVVQIAVHNSNGDYFNEDARPWTIPAPAKGIDKVAQLDGGLKKYHRTYMEYGGVYFRHQNSRKKNPLTGKPFEKEGNIVAEQYVEPLHFGQLVIELPENDKWRPVLEKVASGEPVFWSMGTATPADMCSWCGKRSKSRKDYCKHLKHMLCKTASDGSIICAVNDTTIYHDISHVQKPGCRFAWTLEKVASAGGPCLGNCEGHECTCDDKPDSWVPVEMLRPFMQNQEADRWTLMLKMAAKEKEAPQEPPAVCPSCGRQDEIASQLKGIPMDRLVSALAKEKMLLPPRTFCVILMNSQRAGVPDDDAGACSEPEWLDLVPNLLPEIYSKVSLLPDASELTGDGFYTPSVLKALPDVLSKVRGMSEDLGTEPEQVRRRVIRAVIVPEKRLDKAASAPSEAGRRLAEAAALEYAKYQLAFLASCKDDGLTDLAVMVNRSR